MSSQFAIEQLLLCGSVHVQNPVTATMEHSPCMGRGDAGDGKNTAWSAHPFTKSLTHACLVSEVS